MQISQTLSWPATNWPASSASTQYTVLQVYPNVTPTVITSVTSTTSATISFDDSIAAVYQIRPSSGSLSSPTSYGAEVLSYVVQYVPCRAWLRQNVRAQIADRIDNLVNTSVSPNWPDDELDTYLREAINEFNILFPYENVDTITLSAPTIDIHGNTVGVRNYTLPTDFYLLKTVEYVTPDGKLHLWLKEKPFRGGESTATSYLGYPKLGIMLSPLAGRFYPGHYDVYENQIWVDWDPVGDGDYLNLRYVGKRPQPINDWDLMSLFTPEDMNILSLYIQMKCWLRVEGQDTRLSRWRGAPDGTKRDDLPTLKQSDQIRRLYDQRLNDRREKRPTTRRLVRR